MSGGVQFCPPAPVAVVAMKPVLVEPSVAEELVEVVPLVAPPDPVDKLEDVSESPQAASPDVNAMYKQERASGDRMSIECEDMRAAEKAPASAPRTSLVIDLGARWDAAATLIADHRDVLDARVWTGAPPSALAQRGWSEFLLGLGDEQLRRHEVLGLGADWSAGAPSSLRALLDRARTISEVDWLIPPRHGTVQPRRGETPNKRRQIEAFSEAVRRVAESSSRIIDFGSGHGHLTREIAQQMARTVIGLERDPALVERARKLAEETPSQHHPARQGELSFHRTNAIEEPLAIDRDDCLIGLHACGELGDHLVELAAEKGAAVALVGCCLQKRAGDERRLLAATERLAALGERSSLLRLPRRLLGLSNLTPRENGVERSREENLDGRRRRLALHRLLDRRGLELAPGAELTGLNRRAAHGDLRSLVARAFAVRELPPPSNEEIFEAARWAEVQHQRARRLSLPRALLARPIEILVLLDRAMHLQERGYQVQVGAVFAEEVSARNLGLLASRS